MEELAALLDHVACHAPGQAFDTMQPSLLRLVRHARGKASSAAGTLTRTSCSSRTDGNKIQEEGTLQVVCTRRLHTALRNSLALVAAYVAEDRLPPELLEARRQQQERRQANVEVATSVQTQQQQQQQCEASAGWWAPWAPAGARRRLSRKVLVGFARAVGDAALVATLHDVAVAPELRRRGLGAMLLQRLTAALERRGIVDVGLLTPVADDAAAFFASCDFGDDPEGSVTMVLGTEALLQYASEHSAFEAVSSRCCCPPVQGATGEEVTSCSASGSLEPWVAAGHHGSGRVNSDRSSVPPQPASAAV